MAGERRESDRRQVTVVAEALPAVEDEVQSILRMHQRIAARLLREGNAPRAFSELVRATRAAPLNRRLAAALVRVSARAGAEAAAITLLNAGIEETDGSERMAIRRQLARLLRKLGAHGRAAEQLTLVLNERPADRRTRATLSALLEKAGRWDELDASLEQEVKEAVSRKALRWAARLALHRARLCEERLNDPARAALRYAQALEYRQELGDLEGAFNLGILWLRALKDARTPHRALHEASQSFLGLAGKVGKEESARALVHELEGIDVTPVEAPTPIRRRVTQQTLEVAADEAEARGQKAEAAALLTAAIHEGADARTEQKLEAHYVARGAWQELAHFYRDAAPKAPRDRKVDYLSKLAELLEDELHDTKGAATVYGQIVELTGDRRALDEQVRLLSAGEDLSGVRRALDDAVSRAKDATARAQALVARAEAIFARRDFKAARTDFEEAVRSQPANILARAGLAEVASQLGDRAPVFAFREALGRVPRRRPGRAELYRRLARLAEVPLQDELVARSAWAEVLVEAADDEEANIRLTALARAAEDLAELEPLLRAQIRREARGARTRSARLELVSVLEKKGRTDDALEELRQAVKFEPGHKEAWLALAERCIERDLKKDAAWALEQSATTTADDVERQRTWERLAEYCRTVLGDAPRAQTYAARAEKLKRDIEEIAAERAAVGEEQKAIAHMAPTIVEMAAVTAPGPGPAESTPVSKDPPPPRKEVPWDDTKSRPGHTVEMPRIELELPGDTKNRPPLDETAPVDDVMELTTGDIVLPSEAAEAPSSGEWEAPPGVQDDDEEHVPSEVAELPPSLSQSRPMMRPDLFDQVRNDPLDAEGYRELADYFDDLNDTTRSVLMTEIADALDGDPNAAPRAPKLMLSAVDRAGLRHPLLRSEAGELLSLGGTALCRLFPARGRSAGSKDEFRLDSGRGAQSAADALLAAVRILGVRSADIHISEENGPPFSLVYVNGARVLVGRLAVRKELPEAELRFFAGRALFTQGPDLLALRTLSREQLRRGLTVLGAVLRGDAGLKAEARAVRDSLAPKSMPRLKQLFERVGRAMPLARLVEGARHSVNRAGLVVCGGVAPALAALRAKKSLEAEVADLVRFAASERYLQLRSRRLG
jgi:tetratricopeptide (TPR) repeat protein